jgi:hypothetical protein
MVARENRERESDTGSRNPVAIKLIGHHWVGSVILALRKGVRTGSSSGVLSEAKTERRKMAVRKPKGRDYWMVDLYDKRGQRIRKKVDGSKKLAEIVEADLRLKIAKDEFLGIVEPKKIRFNEFANEFLQYFNINAAKETNSLDRGSKKEKNLVVLDRSIG